MQKRINMLHRAITSLPELNTQKALIPDRIGHWTTVTYTLTTLPKRALRPMQHDPQDLDQHPIADNDSVMGQVPVIDISALCAAPGSLAAQATVEEIAAACRNWGFFQVVNHGIPTAQIESVWAQTHDLFALPQQNKRQLHRSKDNPWGFNDRELTKNQRDKKEIFDFTRDNFDPIYQSNNRWPQELPRFKSVMSAYLEACTSVSLRLLEAFCLGLGMPATFLHPQFVDKHTGFVRLNYYPVADPVAGTDAAQALPADLGIHHHTDAGGLTVLLQDAVSGLQVYRDGLWYNIPTIEGALVINIGDMMQVWSNDLYRAPVHRVLAMATRDRFSIPFFFNPAADCSVAPLPSLTTPGNDSRYRAIKWGEYRGKRSDGDFADYGTEVQISQYRR